MLDRVRRALLELREPLGVESAYVVGSLRSPARWRESSDVDVAVSGCSHAVLDVMKALEGATGRPVDVIDLDRRPDPDAFVTIRDQVGGRQAERFRRSAEVEQRLPDPPGVLRVGPNPDVEIARCARHAVRSQRRPAAVQASTASGHIAAMRSSGDVSPLRSSPGSSPSRNTRTGHDPRARRLASAEPGCGIAFDHTGLAAARCAETVAAAVRSS